MELGALPAALATHLAVRVLYVPNPRIVARVCTCICMSSARTTHATAANETSSRSHAVCEFLLRDASDRVYGRLALVDLAGSERAADSRHHDRQRRMESSEINKSLLALKECIRCVGSSVVVHTRTPSH